MTLTATMPKGASEKTSPRIARMVNDKDICPVFGVAELLRRTAPLWEGRPILKERLFLQSVPPHLNAAEDTLGRWVKETLREAGINMEMYTSHSTRGTSATTALERGVPLDQIMESAGWKNAKTFYAHYHSPLRPPPSEVASTILLGKRKKKEADPSAVKAGPVTRRARKNATKETVIEE